MYICILINMYICTQLNQQRIKFISQQENKFDTIYYMYIYLHICMSICATLVPRCTLPRSTCSPKKKRATTRRRGRRRSRQMKLCLTEQSYAAHMQCKKIICTHTHKYLHIYVRIYNIAVLGCQHLTVNQAFELRKVVAPSPGATLARVATQLGTMHQQPKKKKKIET